MMANGVANVGTENKNKNKNSNKINEHFYVIKQETGY